MIVKSIDLSILCSEFTDKAILLASSKRFLNPEGFCDIFKETGKLLSLCFTSLLVLKSMCEFIDIYESGLR